MSYTGDDLQWVVGGGQNNFPGVFSFPEDFTSMEVAEFLVYDRIVSEPQRRDVERYLLHKYFGIGLTDCNGNGIPDECEPDCDGNGVPDGCQIIENPCLDCNRNGILDTCDIAAGVSRDCNANGVPDECDIDPADPDCDGFTSNDCNRNGVPDECRDLKGDCDCSGAIDFDDIDAFVTALLSKKRYEQMYPNCAYLLADMNCDGVIDFDDIDPFVAALVAGCWTCP
jgi:hypothetical protein